MYARQGGPVPGFAAILARDSHDSPHHRLPDSPPLFSKVECENRDSIFLGKLEWPDMKIRSRMRDNNALVIHASNALKRPAVGARDTFTYNNYNYHFFSVRNIKLHKVWNGNTISFIRVDYILWFSHSPDEHKSLSRSDEIGCTIPNTIDSFRPNFFYSAKKRKGAVVACTRQRSAQVRSRNPPLVSVATISRVAAVIKRTPDVCRTITLDSINSEGDRINFGLRNALRLEYIEGRDNYSFGRDFAPLLSYFLCPDFAITLTKKLLHNSAVKSSQ